MEGRGGGDRCQSVDRQSVPTRYDSENFENYLFYDEVECDILGLKSIPSLRQDSTYSITAWFYFDFFPTK